MSEARRFTQFIFSTLIILSMSLSVSQPQFASAQGSDGIQRQVNAESGKVSFIGPESGSFVSASRALGISSFARPADPAMALAKRFAPEFGLKNPDRDLSVKKAGEPQSGRITVRYQQNYQGIPVLGGELIVNTNQNGDLYSMNGEVSPTLSLSTKPTIDSEQAKYSALQAVAKWYEKVPADLLASEPELWIFDESLLRSSSRPVELVWRLDVTSRDIGMPVRELVLINAQRGSISLHFNQVDTVWSLTEKKDNAQDIQSLSTPQPTETPLPTETPEPVVTTIPTADETPLIEEISAQDLPKTEVASFAGVTWYVFTTGNNSNSCSSISSPCATIDGAIAKASDGDSIYVSSGLYQGSAAIVSITKSITILGGWNSNFSAQTGFSILDGTGNPANTTLLRIQMNTVIERLIIRNSAGGINIANGQTCPIPVSVTVRQSSITGMTTWPAIGGCGSLSLVNSTINNNQGVSGALNNFTGTMIIQNSTITNNSSIGGQFISGGINSTAGGLVSIQNSIISGNTGYGGNSQDCSGSITSAGHNIIGTTSDCIITLQANDMFGVNPQFGPLLPNGYFPLLSSSPAINSAASCPASDQRGVVRPQGSACDIGAYEYATPGNAASLAIISGNGQRTVPSLAFLQPLTVAVLDSRDNLVPNVNVTFTAPGSGASGIFANTATSTSTIASNINGIATAPTFTANSLSGAYTVTASASGAGSVNFNLQNSAWYVASTGNDLNSCLSPNSPCATINGAINKASPGDAIAVATGTYTGTGMEEVVLIDKSLTLAGGWNNTFTIQNGTSTIDGQEARRGISVTSGASVFVDYFTIQNGNHIGGAGIANGGALIINNTTIRQNMGGTLGSGSSGGGGIGNSGTLTLNNSTVNNNIVIGGFYGGGIFNNGTVQLNNSTVSGNSGGQSGVYNDGGNLIINNGTISKNRPYGIYSTGIMWGGTVTLKNTILAGNGTNEDCYGPINTQGYNLIGVKTAECTLTPTAGDLVGTSASPINPRLTLLQDNGGPTFTHALITGSPAINKGNPAVPSSGNNACLATDQHGIARPVDSRCDIGAYEGSTQWTPPYRVSTYTANHTTSVPGSFRCNQTDPACTLGDIRASTAHENAIGTYNLYANQFLRNSLDNKGMTIISTVNYQSGGGDENAFWNGSQVVYEDDPYHFVTADDIVAHELTHGVTQYESNLFYYYQSGAINESFSDLWGEYYDQTNGQGNDTSSVRWLIGEDVFIPGELYGAYRSMSNPPAFDHPDKMSSPNYYKDELDSGGVHINSGVNNKAAFLMVDGGSFNSRTITSLGWEKTLAIYYEVNTNLLISGSDYSDLYYALQQACSNLMGQKGITAADCQEVKDAIDAVEMNAQPMPNFNTDAPLCGSQQTVNTIFFDNFESGTSKWTFTKTGAYPRWQHDSPYGPFAHSGLHSLYADDYPGTITDASARLISVVVPNNGYLHFAHAYGFESYSDYYDGGVLEYSINNGSTWLDAGSLIDYNGYKGIIFTGSGNPLSGRSAFVGDSHGYISTRLNLAPLAGQTVTFRWRMGLDSSGLDWGWWVDDVRVFNCVSTISGNAGVGGVTLSYTDGTAKTVTSSGNGNYSFPVSNNWTGTVTPSHPCFTFTPPSKSYNNVITNQTGQNYTAALKPADGCADVDVTIGGSNVGNYGVAPEKSIFDRYKINGGPVKVSSTNALPILTSQRAIFGSSFNSIVGYPANQLTTDYWFTSYDDTGMITYLVIGNPHPSNTALVDVYIGGVKKNASPYSIAPGQRIFPRYGINAGPVRVVSTNGVNIFTSERTKFGQSFNEVMGYPANQLTTDYWFTSYDDTGMITYLVIGNPDPTITAEVDVYIAGNKMNVTPYSIAPGQRIFPRYGINAGPVQVVSTNGVSIFASERSKFGNTFNEVMGYPANQLTTDYWFTSYDDVGMITYLVIGNPDPTLTAQVDVYINGVKKNSVPYSIAPGQRVFPRYTINAGPVHVVSTNGVNIFTSERSKYLSSFNEILGLADNQLTTDYWFTSYDDLGMTAYLIIAAP